MDHIQQELSEARQSLSTAQKEVETFKEAEDNLK
jgi:hypothetical protein